ncbi:MAG: DUF3459 domain-containing protein [Aquabacterium sp.]
MAMLARSMTHGFAMEGAPHVSDEAVQRQHPRQPSTQPVPLGCVLNFLQNHDQIGNRAFGDRLAQTLPPEPLHLAAAMLLLNPAVPMLFMGEEHGATTPFLYFADWQGELRQAVSEGRRREFARFRAFSDPQARRLIPDPCDPSTFTRSKLDWAAFDSDEARRWQAYWQSLITLRREQIQPWLTALASAGHRSSVHGRVLTVEWLFTAMGEQAARMLRMDVNLGDAAQDVSLPTADAGAQPLFQVGELTPRADRDGTVQATARPVVSLGPWSGCWQWQPAI